MHENLYEEFRERVLSVDAWVSSAKALIDSANLLEPEVASSWRSSHERTPGRWKPLNDELLAVFFMLNAFAIENLLKARLVSLEREAIERELAETGSFPRLLRDHDLYRLACRAGVEPLAIQYELLVHRLTRSAIWYGRYPVPITPAGLEYGLESPNLAPFQAGLWGYSGDDIPKLRELVRALCPVGAESAR